MPVDYIAPDPWVAGFYHRDRVESERQHHRLEDASPAVLKAVAHDRNEPEAARANALLFLQMRRDPEMPEILLELFDDRNQNLWRMVFRSCRSNDQRIKDKLRGCLDDADERNQAAAALALARLREGTILPRLENWLRVGDRSHRNVAIACLTRLDMPEAAFLLRDFWDRGIGDEQDRLVVAAALLSRGDPVGVPFLETAARAVKGNWSVFAATSIHAHDRRRGLELMLGIVETGDLEARQALVNQIWNWEDLPHAFTADGIHEARVWIESQLNLAAGHTDLENAPA